MLAKPDYRLRDLIEKAMECQDKMRLAYLNNLPYAPEDAALDVYMREILCRAMDLADTAANYQTIVNILGKLPGAEEAMRAAFPQGETK